MPVSSMISLIFLTSPFYNVTYITFRSDCKCSGISYKLYLNWKVQFVNRRFLFGYCRQSPVLHANGSFPERLIKLKTLWVRYPKSSQAICGVRWPMMAIRAWLESPARRCEEDHSHKVTELIHLLGKTIEWIRFRTNISIRAIYVRVVILVWRAMSRYNLILLKINITCTSWNRI